MFLCIRLCVCVCVYVFVLLVIVWEVGKSKHWASASKNFYETISLTFFCLPFTYPSKP
jgi:hypothetical protein